MYRRPDPLLLTNGGPRPEQTSTQRKLKSLFFLRRANVAGNIEHWGEGLRLSIVSLARETL